jgi:hypothetical protein
MKQSFEPACTHPARRRGRVARCSVGKTDEEKSVPMFAKLVRLIRRSLKRRRLDREIAMSSHVMD